MKYIHFHALKEDLLPVLQMVESNGPVKYVRTGNFLREEIKDGIDVFNHGTEIPYLGKATADSSVACETYLVCKQDTLINLRYLRATAGVERVCVDQLLNPETITFTPGGILNEETVLHGLVGTASDSEGSQALMKRYHSAIRKHFSKIKAFYVGPKALAMLERGARLTMSAQSPREFDLTVASK